MNKGHFSLNHTRYVPNHNTWLILGYLNSQGPGVFPPTFNKTHLTGPNHGLPPSAQAYWPNYTKMKTYFLFCPLQKGLSLLQPPHIPHTLHIPVWNPDQDLTSSLGSFLNPISILAQALWNQALTPECSKTHPF